MTGLDTLLAEIADSASIKALKAFVATRDRTTWEHLVAEFRWLLQAEADAIKRTLGLAPELRVFAFNSKQQTDGDSSMKKLLGGKGANLAQMAKLGLPVPPGFTLPTTECQKYNELEDPATQFPDEDLRSKVETALSQLEEAMGQRFGGQTDASAPPLLISVRSGAAISMPGMMDTVLNVGLNDTTVAQLADAFGGNTRFAYDSYRRLIQMFGNVVRGISSEHFEHALTKAKVAKGVQEDVQLEADDLKALVEEYKQVYLKHTGEAFPMDPKEQLWQAIRAVFGSWNNPRAIKYRDINHIHGLLGTAVNVQCMVFGNMGNTSATGVAFTRNPSNGINKFYGEYLCNAQGEDVVAGIRTPQQLRKEASQEWAQRQGVAEEERAAKFPSLEESMPEIYKELATHRQTLEQYYKDMQDIEFTIQDAKLFFLQTRTGKRTIAAALRCAREMLSEGLIDCATAVKRIPANQLDQLLHPTLDTVAAPAPVATGLPASPGAAVGQAVFSADVAEEWAGEGRKVILIRDETSPEDIGGMHAAEGVLTARGGMTSHAAVVARGMGKPCVAGCSAVNLTTNTEGNTSAIIGGNLVVNAGDYISLDGTSGRVYQGKVPLQEPDLGDSFQELMDWCNKFRKLQVWTNADTPKDAANARRFGAEGIGLVRTEHMFFGEDRIDTVRKMILASEKQQRLEALSALHPMQEKDFLGLFRVMEGRPVTIRLLDPPLHEFVPKSGFDELAKKLGMGAADVEKRCQQLHEMNPMLGHRGCRLGITYPEVYRMQVNAMFCAAIKATSGDDAVPVQLDIMVPLVGHETELAANATMIREVAKEVLNEKKTSKPLNFRIGTMIEVPRACLVADKLARDAEFFSFGTNDLTQMTCGLSRDDAGPFLMHYTKHGLLKHDPFQVLDQEGVGQLMRMAVTSGRGARPSLKVGICGEHGGEPSSVAFCHKLGLDYVSCSPFRVPVAILAAAQAALAEQ